MLAFTDWFGGPSKPTKEIKKRAVEQKKLDSVLSQYLLEALHLS